jgi:integrase/recombinase XerD
MELSAITRPSETLSGQADSDQRVLDMWLHGKSEHTRRAYRADVERFLSFAQKALSAVALGDVQAFSDSLADLAASSRARTLAAIKSLLSFSHRIGYAPFNVGAAVRLPSVKNRLAERILPESDVHRLIALEPNARNRVLVRLLYAGGLRVSEVCDLTWRDVRERGDAGQVTVYGKGGKTRHVLLSVDTWHELAALRGGPNPDAPVFRSRKGGHLTPVQVLRIVRAGGHRAGIEEPVSPHWLRHAHASHALDRGCPISLVQATLGHASVSTTGKYLHARPGDSSARYLGL